jgi:hypothetical protein
MIIETINEPGMQRRLMGQKYGQDIYRSWTRAMGAWYWIAIETADGGYGVLGGRTFPTLMEACAFARVIAERDDAR